jgi:hypothetical protein
METEGITGQENFEALENRLAADIDAYIARRLAVYAERETELEELLKNLSTETLEREISAQFPAVGGLSLKINTLQYPDFILYRASRRLYEDFLSSQRQMLTAPLGERANRRVEAQLRLEELKSYGELFTKYPVLLEYLKLESGGSN